MIRLADGTMLDPITGTVETVEDTIRRIAQEEGIDPDVAVAVARQESGLNPMAVGDGGHSHGLFQENDAGRGAGRAPDYDVEGQVRRFAAEYKQVQAANPDAAGATLAYLAQRPADREGYIASISAMLGTGGGGGGGRLMSTMPDAWVPKGPIKKLVKVGTQYQVIYADESIPPEMVDADQIDTPDGDTTRSTSTGNAAQIAATARNQASQQSFTAQQNAISQQFDQAVQKWREAVDSRDYDAAQFWAKRADEFKVQQTEAGNADRNVRRGETLLGLGTRPETLGRYLYALQGQQTPQGFDFGTSALPGFGPNAKNPTVGGLGGAQTAAPAIPGAPAGALPGAIADPRVTAVQNAIATPGAPLGGFVAPGGTSITQTDPRLGPIEGQMNAAPILPGMAPSLTQPPTNEQLGAQDALVAAGRVPRFYSNGVAIFGQGGVIPEPVVGEGAWSGLPYLFGEKGPEEVKKAKKPYRQPKGDGTYQQGGVIGANATGQQGYWLPGDATTPPRFVPTGVAAPSIPGMSAPMAAPNPGSLPGLAGGGGMTGGMRGAATQGASVFNPSQLGQYLSGQFLRPGIPNFPQYQQATGGTSLLSNARWLNNATPTERGLFEGFQRDEAGIMPEDALALANRMAPRNSRRALSYGRSY